MLYTNDSRKINKRTMEIAEPFKPDLKKFDNGKEFNEMYNKGETFYQVYYYDRHKEYTGYRTNFHIDLDKAEEFRKAYDLYVGKLNEAQEQAIKEFGLGEYDSRTYYYNNRVAQSFGYCHLEMHERNKQKEKARDEELRKMYEDEDEVNCTSCGDGGCIHCEPQYFI